MFWECLARCLWALQNGDPSVLSQSPPYAAGRSHTAALHYLGHQFQQAIAACCFHPINPIVFGVAHSMPVVFRAAHCGVFGDGGLHVLNEIVLADLTALKERSL